MVPWEEEVLQGEEVHQEEVLETSSTEPSGRGEEERHQSQPGEEELHWVGEVLLTMDSFQRRKRFRTHEVWSSCHSHCDQE